MTEQDALDMLETILIDGDGDAEVQHSDADRVLCQLLQELGYDRVVAKWQSIPKWYA